MLRVSLLVATLVAIVGVVAGPSLAARSHSTGTTVSVTATEFHFKFSKTSVPAGSVTFVVKNAGKVSHDLKIGGKKTPLIKPGKTAKLTVTLKKGKAPYTCTVPGHAAAGMKGTLTVK
jgi:uncharacterized cupredoxin-like copper-binding protein